MLLAQLPLGWYDLAPALSGAILGLSFVLGRRLGFRIARRLGLDPH